MSRARVPVPAEVAAHRAARRALVRRIAFLARYAHQSIVELLGRRPTAVELFWFELEITRLLEQCPPTKFG